jgi:uncharacterized protein (TIGR03382 family)
MLIAAPAFAAPVLEAEVNNTFATANFLTPAEQAAFAGSNSFVFDGVLTGGFVGGPASDVDWVSFTLPSAGYLTAGLFGIPNSQTGDTIMGLFDSTGAWIAADDDSNIGAWPALEATLAAGRYYIVIGHFGDATTTGPSNPGDWNGLNSDQMPVSQDTLQYKLVIGFNAIPTPGAAALVGLGGLALGRRRR